MPLLKNDKFIDELISLPIATHLPSGYLAIQPLGLGKGVGYYNISYLFIL